MVSDTRYPALCDCEYEWGEAGQQPQRGLSPVEHGGFLFVPLSVLSNKSPCILQDFAPLRATAQKVIFLVWGSNAGG